MSSKYPNQFLGPVTHDEVVKYLSITEKIKNIADNGTVDSKIASDIYQRISSILPDLRPGVGDDIRQKARDAMEGAIDGLTREQVKEKLKTWLMADKISGDMRVLGEIVSRDNCTEAQKIREFLRGRPDPLEFKKLGVERYAEKKRIEFKLAPLQALMVSCNCGCADGAKCACPPTCVCGGAASKAKGGCNCGCKEGKPCNCSASCECKCNASKVCNCGCAEGKACGCPPSCACGCNSGDITNKLLNDLQLMGIISSKARPSTDDEKKAFGELNTYLKQIKPRGNATWTRTTINEFNKLDISKYLEQWRNQLKLPPFQFLIKSCNCGCVNGNPCNCPSDCICQCNSSDQDFFLEQWDHLKKLVNRMQKTNYASADLKEFVDEHSRIMPKKSSSSFTSWVEDTIKSYNSKEFGNFKYTFLYPLPTSCCGCSTPLTNIASMKSQIIVPAVRSTLLPITHAMEEYNKSDVSTFLVRNGRMIACDTCRDKYNNYLKESETPTSPKALKDWLMPVYGNFTEKSNWKQSSLDMLYYYAGYMPSLKQYRNFYEFLHSFCNIIPRGDFRASLRNYADELREADNKDIPAESNTLATERKAETKDDGFGIWVKPNTDGYSPRDAKTMISDLHTKVESLIEGIKRQSLEQRLAMVQRATSYDNISCEHLILSF